jgi:hypothetical protein
MHVHRKGQHIAEVRISGHTFDNITKRVNKIKNKGYNYLFIDYSKYVNGTKHEGFINHIRDLVKPQRVDYVYINQMPNTSKNILIMTIMSKILKYLFSNELIQTSSGNIKITWAGSEQKYII